MIHSRRAELKCHVGGVVVMNKYPMLKLMLAVDVQGGILCFCSGGRKRGVEAKLTFVLFLNLPHWYLNVSKVLEKYICCCSYFW